jgi:hypothetical protein
LLTTTLQGHEYCTQLLEDDQGRAERRLHLKDKKLRLEMARDRLQELQNNPNLYEQAVGAREGPV